MLYDILQDGFPTPLSAKEIAQLFNAGRVGRQTPCKPQRANHWRTLDEIFPLLKYDTSRQLVDQPSESHNRALSRRPMMIAIVSAGILAAAVILFFAFRDSGMAVRPAQPTAVVYETMETARPRAVQDRDPVAAVVSTEETQQQAPIRPIERERLTEQARFDQTRAEQDRIAKERLLLEQQKAAGRDTHLPLDQWCTVDVGGQSVSVKIHDNDTTSFELWINGAHYREVKKQKGITGSRTDETLIYNNGRTALYYVWEISGRIDHCLLRVRDS